MPVLDFVHQPCSNPGRLRAATDGNLLQISGSTKGSLPNNPGEGQHLLSFKGEEDDLARITEGPFEPT